MKCVAVSFPLCLRVSGGKHCMKVCNFAEVILYDPCVLRK